MKKLYSLLAAMVCAASLTAQNISIKIDGQDVPNGSTHTKYYAEDRIWNADLENYLAGIYPEVIFKSAVNGNVTVTLTSLDKNEDVGFCWGGECEMTFAKTNYKAVKTDVSYNKTLHGEQDLEIEVIHDTPWTENYTRELDLTVTQKGETFTCKIILGVDPEKAAGISGTGSKKPVSFASNTLTFNLGSAATVSLYSVTGSEVLKKDINSTGSVSLSTLPKGVYIYKVNGTSKTHTGKVVVK